MEIVVLIWQAMVGGEAQMLAVQQPDMLTCAERLGEMMKVERIPGQKIGGQQAWLDVVDAEGRCVKMTLDELFEFGNE